MIIACKSAALGGRRPEGRISDHEGWDRATCQRYLAAAMRLEATSGPQMRCLREEIGQIERLRTLLTAI